MNRKLRPICEKLPQPRSLVSVECCESRQRRTSMAIERRRNPPDASRSGRPLLKLVEIVFLHTIGRISDDRMERVLGNPAQPFQAIRMDNQGSPDRREIVVEYQRMKASILHAPKCT